MGHPGLDAVDAAILDALQEDARHNTNAAISDRAGVSASTVGKRISRLEAAGIIRGYRLDLNYGDAGFPLQVLFVCTVPIRQRETLIRQTLEVDGVLDVRELMTGEGNVHVHVAGRSTDDITRVAHELDQLAFTVLDEILVKNEHGHPSLQFELDGPEG